MIYKILRAPEWRALCEAGATSGAPVDMADGYIHFSTAAQLAGTADRHFAGETGLRIMAVDETALGADLRWEPSRGGQMFPHLYRDLRLSDAVWVRPVGTDAGAHLLPPGIA